MKKMNLAEGSLVLLGFLISLSVVISKVSGLNLLEQIADSEFKLLLVANTCFVIAFIINFFGGEE
jgi:hypothetical protein